MMVCCTARNNKTAISSPITIALNKLYFRLATYSFLSIALFIGYAMTMANNVPPGEGNGGGWTKQSGYPLVDLSTLDGEGK